MTDAPSRPVKDAFGLVTDSADKATRLIWSSLDSTRLDDSAMEMMDVDACRRSR